MGRLAGKLAEDGGGDEGIVRDALGNPEKLVDFIGYTQTLYPLSAQPTIAHLFDRLPYFEKGRLAIPLETTAEIVCREIDADAYT